MSEVKMTKGAETLASLIYTRDNDGQLKKAIVKGLPGEEATEYTYDENNRLSKGSGTAYEYDAANDPKKIGANTYTYDSDDELEGGAGATYAYDEAGERTKTSPSGGPATTYGYDQAGNLTSVERPSQGKVLKINDSYTYDGNGLRASQTIAGTTTHMAWDTHENEPLLLSDGTNSYVYGPGNFPIEQINGKGEVLYRSEEHTSELQSLV